MRRGVVYADSRRQVHGEALIADSVAIPRPRAGDPRIGRLSLSRFAKGYIRGYAFIAVLTVMASLFALLHPWPLQILVDHVIGDAASPGWLTRLRGTLPGAGTTGGAIGYIAAAGLVIFALDSLFDVLLTMSWIRVGQRMVYDLACNLYSRVLRRSLLFHARAPVGDTLSRITGDSWCIYNAAAAVFFTPAHAIIVGGAAIWFMARQNGRLTLVACAVGPLLALSSMLFGRLIRNAKGQERQAESSIESHVQRTLAGMPVVQAFAQEEREHRRFLDFTRSATSAQRRSAVVVALASGAGGLITTLGTGAVLLVGTREVQAGRLTLGELLVFLAYLATLHRQCTAVASTYSELKGLGASTRRITELVAEEPRVAGGDEEGRFGAGLSVSMRGVRFAYEPGQPVLDGMNLEIPPGKMLGVVGASGAGKSTLAALMLRLYDPDAGEILIDGRDARGFRLESLRGAIALVTQEPYLLPRSVAENISMGRPGADRGSIEAAAAVAQADEFIRQLPDGYDTVLGERGMTLSGGERQRLAIARAVLKDAPLLILDEATSSLDSETEARFLDAVERQRGGSTVVVIAHRLTTVQRADMIAVLEDGRVVEVGTHEELLRREGVYGAMWREQRRMKGRAPAGVTP